MTNTNIASFSSNISGYIERAIVYGDIVSVSTGHGNAVVMSEEEYKSMVETLRLSSIPGMVESIKAAAAEPASECVPYDPAEPW